MAMFTPRSQLRDMQQAAAAQLLAGASRDPQANQQALYQSVAASLLLGSPVQVLGIENNFLGDNDLML